MSVTAEDRPDPRRSPAPPSDADLVAAVRRGDSAAFGELYARHRARVHAHVRGMVGDHARAEDVTQEVFLAALRRLRETERPIDFRPWIHAIATNACIDQHRRSRRAAEVPFDADEQAAASAAERRPAGAPAPPEAAMESRQRLDELRGAFGGLSDAHHRILVHRELEGLSYREIGERMDLSRPAVESTLFRARRRLSQEYRELVTGRRCRGVRAAIRATAGGALAGAERRRVQRHLTWCDDCRRHARALGVRPDALPERARGRRLGGLIPMPAALSGVAGGSKAAVAVATLAVATGGAGGAIRERADASDRPVPAVAEVRADARPAVRAALGAGAETERASGPGGRATAPARSGSGARSGAARPSGEGPSGDRRRGRSSSSSSGSRPAAASGGGESAGAPEAAPRPGAGGGSEGAGGSDGSGGGDGSSGGGGTDAAPSTGGGPSPPDTSGVGVEVPSVPVPSAPSAPSVPSTPSLPSAPSVPSTPSLPSAPSAPSVPETSLPSTSSVEETVGETVGSLP